MIKKRIYIPILLVFIFIGIAIADVIIDPSLETKVLGGRTLVDNFRTEHDKQYVNGTKVNDVEWDLVLSLTGNLSILGYDSENITNCLDSFFYDSGTYNAQLLGYKNLEDFNTNANILDQALFNAMWN